MSIFVITGPSGVGKSYLLAELAKHDIVPFQVHTDREKRPTETGFTDRIYVSKEEFSNLLPEFIYWFEFSNNRYGYHKKRIEALQQAGKSLAFNITPTHLIELCKVFNNIHVIVLRSNDYELLTTRLLRREIHESDSKDIVQKKTENVEKRIEFAKNEETIYKQLPDVCGLCKSYKEIEVINNETIEQAVIPYILSIQS